MKICLLLLSLIGFLYLHSQSELYGKYRITEANNHNYEGFALCKNNEAIFFKSYKQKFLFANELPFDSLTVLYNPGILKVKEFPIEMQLLQLIVGTWSFKNDSLCLFEGEYKVLFRALNTGWLVSESHIDGFTSIEPLIYYKFEGFDENGLLSKKLKILDFNKDQLPVNYDVYEYFTEMPKVVFIKTKEGIIVDSLFFESGNGLKEIIVSSKLNRGRNNESSNYELNRKRLTGYFKKKLHGYDYTYYHPNEIKEEYQGNRFLLKCEAWYEVGLKHGKWLYYDTKGTLIKTEIWKKDKLIKTK